MDDVKLAIVFGTRPEIIKLAPIIWSCQERNVPFFSIHTGQHFSDEMDKVFFDALKLPEPKYRLNVGKRGLVGHGPQTGAMMTEIESILLQEIPSVVVVQGDTNTVLAAALVASKIPVLTEEKRIAVAHVEAGLRSYDRRMPEEVNRIMTDHISDFLFVPTDTQRQILLNEGIQDEKIFVTGNTIVDAVTSMAGKKAGTSTVLAKLELVPKSYALLTLHRQENVDSKNVLLSILEGINRIIRETDIQIVFPMHPRTEKRLIEFGIQIPPEIKVIPPVDYIDFVALESSARILITDSGGVQEEGCILRVPCLTLRESTERPETVEVGANHIAGTEPENILLGFRKMMTVKQEWPNPFGDGKTADKIVKIITGQTNDL